MSYKIDKTYALAANEGSPRKAQNLYIIAHETANATATGRNEATYMKRNWRNAYTHFIVGDGGKVWQIGEPGYVAWGALDANPFSPMQVELQHSLNKDTFKKNYAVYIELIRDYAKKYGIPLTLDVGGRGVKGVKSHLWVTQNYGGSHTDPYGYLSKMGISKAQFAKDIANGVGSSNHAPKPKPKPQPSKKTVKVKKTAWAWSKSSGGKRIPDWVKGGTFELAEKRNYKQDKSTAEYVIKNKGVVLGAILAQDIEGATEVVKPSKPQPSGIKWYAERGTFTANETINVRDQPSTRGKVVAQYKKGQSVIYDKFCHSGGYVWLSYMSNSGHRRYMVAGRSNGSKRTSSFGTFR